MSPASISESHAAPDREIRSASPVVSTTILAENGVTAFLAFEDGAFDRVAVTIGAAAPGVKQQPRLGFARHLHRQRLERLGIDGRRPRDDAVIGRGSLRPIGRGRSVAAAPVGARRPGDGIFRQPINELLGKTANDVPAGPIGHPVDPDNKAAGREPTQVIVALS